MFFDTKGSERRKEVKRTKLKAYSGSLVCFLFSLDREEDEKEEEEEEDEKEEEEEKEGKKR